MRHLITSLPAIACFRAAAEFESFSQAAAKLNLTHSAISRAVRLLEQDLGTPLFTRQHRRVFLTDAGRDFARAVALGLGGIEAAAQAIHLARQDRPITLSCEPTLLMRWLIPRIGAFRAAHPTLHINLVAGGGPVTLGTGIDFAIRRNDFDWPAQYHASHLFDERTGPVCRPEHLSRLRDLPPLHSKTRPEAWARWCAVADQPLPNLPGQSFEHFYFSLQAAVAGLGIAIGPWHLVQDDLASGQLAAPFGFVPDGSSYHLLSANALPESGPAMALYTWLRSLDAPDQTQKSP